jgi:hypothetical protein
MLLRVSDFNGFFGRVSRMGETYTKFWEKTLKERDHFEDLDVDVRTILKCI